MPRISIYVDEALHLMMQQRPDINYSAVCKPAIVAAVNTPQRDILDVTSRKVMPRSEFVAQLADAERLFLRRGMPLDEEPDF